MSAGVLLYLWNEWRIQLLVLLSFALQVFLFVFGEIRRRSSSTVLRISLWSAYLLADSTAIYALGHMSIISEAAGEHQLMAFWAPFLLLHLGGPDNITAYSLEDNRLWLRHLQTLVVQALAAAYVLYKYMASSGTLLLLASISMFVVGLLKYAERTWALKSASDYAPRCFHVFFLNKEVAGVEPISDEDILFLAHKYRYVLDFEGQIVRPIEVTWLYKLIEMELSLTYDQLYTKAAVIYYHYKGYGLCVRLILLLGTTASFVLFQLNISSTNRHNRADVIVSYVLLVGALVLEIMSVCRILLSSWFTYFLFRHNRWLRISCLLSLHRLINPAKRRLWRYSIGQYNLIHLTTRDRTKLRSRLARMIRIENWWNKLHFSGSFLGTNSLSMQDFKVLVVKAVLKLNEPAGYIEYNARGTSWLRRRGVHKGFASWSVDVDFDLSILVWHIATDMYIQESDIEHDEQIAEAIRVLSNYMIFLLVVKPDILPCLVKPDDLTLISQGRQPYLSVIDYLDDELSPMRRPSLDGDEDSVKSGTRFWNRHHMFKELFCHEGPNSSGVEQEEKFRQKFMHDLFEKAELESQEMPDPRDRHNGDVCIQMATGLARELLAMQLSGRDKLEMIFEVWVEMMLYGADDCSRESHARELSNGGEFITIVWCLSKRLKGYKLEHDVPSSPSMDMMKTGLDESGTSHPPSSDV